MKVLACAFVVALLAGCGGNDERKPVIAADKTGVVRGSLSPDVHLFGEPVVAQIDVIVNRAKADPDEISIKTDFEPYERVGETRTTRTDMDDVTHLRYTTTLNCLNEHCIPRTVFRQTTVSQIPGAPVFLRGQQRDEKVKYEFPPAVVTAGEGGDAVTIGRVVWAPLRSLSRVNWYDSSLVGQGFPFVAEVTPLPEPGYRVSPTFLGLGLLAVAFALLALPAWLLWDRRRRRAAPAKGDKPALSPLERALALVEWASGRPSVDARREALEALAYELDADERAAQAREQGWSPPKPEPEEMTELVTSIRKSDAPTS